MAIKIESATGSALVGMIGSKAFEQKVDITTDTEAEITALPAYGQPVTDSEGTTVIPAKNSMAHVAGYKAIYELSPSGTWVKV